MAEAHYTSGRKELATFGFPGLYYPGLLTIGPSLHLYGELSGQISLSGRYSASVGYDFPVSIRVLPIELILTTGYSADQLRLWIGR